MKMMIVDDSNIMRRVIQKYSENLNISIVATAGDGKTAVELFKKYLPDIVTLDITMPEMDGLSCLTEIIKIKTNVKVIIITALNDTETGLLAIRKGAVGFITKPFTENDIKEELKSIIGEKL